MQGVDTKKNSSERTLVDGLLSPAVVVTMTAVTYGITFITILLLAMFAPAPLEYLFSLYFFLLLTSYLYSAGVGLKYIALGDVAHILVIGPALALFAYVLQVRNRVYVVEPRCLSICIIVADRSGVTYNMYCKYI